MKRKRVLIVARIICRARVSLESTTITFNWKPIRMPVRGEIHAQSDADTKLKLFLNRRWQASSFSSGFLRRVFVYHTCGLALWQERLRYSV